MTVHRIRKADINSGTGSLREREVRRAFKTLEPKKVRMCRGCSRPKVECICATITMQEAVRSYHAIIEAMRAEWDAQDRAARKAKRVARQRAKIKIVR